MTDGLDFSAGGTPVDAPGFTAVGKPVAAPDFSSGGTLVPDSSAQLAARARHSTLGDIGRSALGALETGAGEGLQGIGDVVHWRGASNLGKRIQAAGAREQANVSPQFAEKTSHSIFSREGFNPTNIASSAINSIAGFAPQSAAALAAAALGGPLAGVAVGSAAFGTQGEAGGRNAGEQQVAALSDADIAKVPAYQQAIAAGATPAQARTQLSDSAANRGAWTSGLFGAGLGLVGEIPGVGAIGDFAARKLARGVGRVAGADTALASRGVARVIGKGIGEGVGFGGINAAGQVASNVTNPVPTPTFENVGEAAASGLLPGFAMGAGRAGLQHLARPSGPLGRAAQTAQDTGAASPEPFPGTGPITQAGAASAAPEMPASGIEAQPALTRKMPPPPVPWVNPETGESRTPAASEVVAAFHRMQDDQAQADANNVKLVTGLSQLSDAWGVPLERLKSLRKVALNERAKGMTTADAEARAAEDFAQQGATDTFQSADRALGDVNVQANDAAASLADIRARLAQQQAVRATPDVTGEPATPPVPEVAAETVPVGPAARAPDEVPAKPEIASEPPASDAAQAAPAPSDAGSTPVDQEAGAVPISSSNPPDVGIEMKNTPNVGENQDKLTENEASAQAAGAAASAEADENAVPPVTPTRVVKASVPLGAGMSADGKTMYVDHRIPDVLDVPRGDGTTVKVQLYSPEQPAEGGLPVHEGNEFPQMLRGKNYADAHDENANAAEDAYYQQKYGVTRDAVDKALKPYLDAAKEQGANAKDIPADLDKTPYTDSGEAGLLEAKRAPQEGDAVRITKGGFKGETGTLGGVAGANLRNVIIRGGRKAGVHAIHVDALEHASTTPETAASKPSTESVKPSTEAVVVPGDRVTVTKGAHADKAATVVGRTRSGTRLKFDDGKQATLSAKVLQRVEPKAEASRAPSTGYTEQTPPQGGVSASGAIADVGEKIGGARKDTAVKTGRSPRADKAAEASAEKPGWMNRYEVSQITSSSRVGETGRWTIHDKRQKGRSGNFIRRTDQTFATKAEAEAAVPLLALVRNHGVGRREEGNYGIYRRVTDRKRVWLKDGFATPEDAKRYMAQHAKDLIETKTSVGEEALPKPETVTRQGPARRQGDVKPEQFRDAFGFRGVEFGNWNSQGERQEVMNHAFDGLHDLSELLGIPPKAISLNGELGLAFGARGQGLTGARAHYERDRAVMNLTKMKGAGALAHEWFHALDHYLGRESGSTSKEWRTLPDGTRVLKTMGDVSRDMASYGVDHPSALRDELRQAYATLINTMQRTATRFVRDTAKLEQFTGKARERLEEKLTRVRDNLAQEQKFATRGKMAPASAEQMAEFDAIAQRMVNGENLELRTEASKPSTGRRFSSSYRTTNDDLNRLSAIMKAVRGRAGFSADGHGIMNEIAGLMRAYDVRLKEAADARANPEADTTKPTSFRMEAIKADQGRGTNYWSTHHEMAARAFSAYVEDKLAAEHRSSDFLSYGSDERFRLLIPEFPRPFPGGDERVAIDKAFDTFFKTVKSAEDGAGNVRLFSKPATEQPERRTFGLPESVKEPLAAFRNDRPLKHDPDYKAAKAGNAEAAVRLVQRLAGPMVAEARARFGDGAIYVAPHAEESTGNNAIPAALAEALAAATKGSSPDDVMQTNRVHHTGADIMQRLIARPQFEGDVKPGGRYVLVDDVTTSGGTFADLADYIRSKGGDVVGATSLVNAARGGKLAAEPHVLRRLEGRHGDVIREQFGIEPSALTAGEANYLTGFRSTDEIRTRAAKAARERDARLRAKGIQGLASRPDEVTDNAPLKAGRSASGGIDPARLDRVVASAKRNWGKNQPDVEVVASPEGLPADAKRDPDYKRSEGYYDGKKVWLVASNLSSESRARQVLAHEAVGHYGVDRIVEDAYGKDAWNKITQSVTRLDREGLGGKALQDVLAEAHRRYPTADAATFAKEAVAVMAERGIHNGIVDRVVTAVRQYLRKIMPNLDLSAAEIRQLLVRSDRLLRSGSERAYREQVGMVAAHAFDKTPDTFYSALTEAVGRGKGAPKSADATAWKQWLDGAQRRGEFKQGEREWMGVDQWLDQHKGPVTRTELNDFVRQNQVHVQEVVHGDEPPINAADIRENDDGTFDLVDAGGELATAPDRPTKFGDYTLPGAKNYRELLLTLPGREKPPTRSLEDVERELDPLPVTDPRWQRLFDEREAIIRAGMRDASTFRSSHFDEPNIVAHVRFNDRTGPDGEKILHVEEVQSDMHQQGRKHGYFDPAKPWQVFETGSGDVVARFATEREAEAESKARGNRFDFGRGAEGGAVPDAPFKKTEQWSMLAMKRVLRWAADHGYDKVTWTTGEQQAARYDLSKQVKAIEYMDGNKALSREGVPPGSYRIHAVNHDGKVAFDRIVPRGELEGLVGKELAQKIIDDQGSKAGALLSGMKALTGVDLKLGGEGMRAFYDKMLPNELNKYVKQWGAKVGETTIAKSFRYAYDKQTQREMGNRDADNVVVHSLDITPAMRESVQQGQPLFSLSKNPTARDYLDQPDVPVIRLRGDEIKGATPADVRRNANEFIRRWLQELARATGGKAVHNERTGFDIGVTQNRVHHGFVHQGPENVKLVAAMEGLLRNAAPIDRRAHVPPRDEIQQVHTLVAPLEIAGQRFAVKLTVKEGRDGSYKLYDHQALKMESPDSTSGTTTTDVARSRPMSGDSASIRDMLTAFKGDNAKYVPHDTSAPTDSNPPTKSGGLFSKPAPADPSKEPARGMQDLEKALADVDPGGIWTKAKAWMRGKAEDLRPAALGALQTRHILELMEDSVPLKGTGKQYARSMQQLDADREQLMVGAADAKDHPQDMLKKGAVNIAQELRRLAYGKGLNLRGKIGREAKRLFDIMHQATLQRMDPSRQYERLTIENAHGDAVPWTPESVKARLKLLRELMLQRGGDAWADREKISDEVKYLRNIAKLERAREANWPKLQADYEALTPEAKRLYGEVRDWYSQYRDATEEALIHNIEAMDVPETYRRSLVNRMRLQFEEQRREGVYFPLNRDGDYWVSFQDKEGNEGFKMFEQYKDLKTGVQRLRNAGFQIDASGRRSLNAKAKDAPSGTFVREVIDTLAKAKVSEKVQDEVYQTFLRSMPELSMRKHSIHRRNIAGFSEDALRAFAKNSYHGAHQLARLRHAQDMNTQLEVMQASLDNWRRGENATDERAEPKTSDVVKADALAAELRKRHEWIMNPNDQRLANMANSIGFIYYLGASPASAITNLTQIAQTVVPVLGARHGWVKGSRMLGAAWRDAARTGGHMDKVLKNDEERRAFLQMQQRGDFSKTQAHTLAGLAEGNVLQTNPAWSKTMNAISWMFHNAELVNREATGMAAFRLARMEGKSFDEAVQYAGDTNALTNFDYSAANRPRYMQGNVQRIALQFKNYSVGMTWLFYRNLFQAMKGETPEVRSVARRTVAGVLGMTALLAGTTGLPVYNAVKMAANAANTLFGDDDEPWNFDDAFHRWLADNLGPDAARLIAEGPTNYLTGANLSSRTSMANLWLQSDQQHLEGADAYHALLENLAGPMGGITSNFYVGAEDVRRGHLERGIERILPTSVKNSIKALRYAHEGVNSMRGDPIVPDVSGYEDFLQAIGFQPAKVADQYRINTSKKNYTGEIKDRRINLMNAYAMAVKGGDSGDQQSAMQKIAAFNQAHPEWAITRPVLQSSLRQRAQLSAQAQHGLILSKRLQQGAADYVGATQ